MSHPFVDINLNEKKPETFTQAYHAGILYARVKNFFPTENIPTFSVCMVNYHSLRELFGERLWQKLKTKPGFKYRIRLYEALAYQPSFPRAFIGTSSDFCLGYVKSYEASKSRMSIDRRRAKDIQQMKEIVSKLYGEN